jgi:hypothetical protein
MSRVREWDKMVAVLRNLSGAQKESWIKSHAEGVTQKSGAVPRRESHLLEVVTRCEDEELVCTPRRKITSFLQQFQRFPERVRWGMHSRTRCYPKEMRLYLSWLKVASNQSG